MAIEQGRTVTADGVDDRQDERRMVARVRTSTTAGQLRYDVSVTAPGIAFDGANFFVEISGDRVPPPVDRHDFVVLALIFAAMRSGCDLHVEGRLSSALLRNLEEFQRAWSAWRPARYRQVRISCEEEVAALMPVQRHRAVLAYSGGVDSSFVLARLLHPLAGEPAHELVTAVMIHGFDIPLAAVAGFAAAEARVRETMTAPGVPLTVVRTDMRETLSRHWADEFAAVIAGSLALFQPIAGTGLVGSDGDYVDFLLPWGSNMITNPMLSSDAFCFETVGDAVPRTERVRRIAQYPAIADRLRVCWGDKMPGENCGHCEKCVRTKLNFLVLSEAVPTSLGASPGFADIVGVVVEERRKLFSFRELSRTARREQAPWRLRWAIRLMMWKNHVLLPFRGLRRLRRNIGRLLTGRPLLPR